MPYIHLQPNIPEAPYNVRVHRYSVGRIMNARLIRRTKFLISRGYDKFKYDIIPDSRNTSECNLVQGLLSIPYKLKVKTLVYKAT